MWVFTTRGFISAVQHRDNHEMLMVRARTEQALDELANMTRKEISRTPSADYPFRLVVDREMFNAWLANEVDNIDYGNFKNAAHVLGDPSYDDALMDVWSAMYASEHPDSRKST